MIAALFLTSALAGGPVVTVGNGVVAAPPEGLPSGDVAGAWVSVLADCLEENRPAGFPVVDQSVKGATIAGVQAEVASIRALKPSVIVLTVGAAEMARDEPMSAAVEQLGAVVTALRASGGPPVLLVGAVAPTLDQLDWPDDVAARQATVDEKTAKWNGALQDLAKSDDGVWHLDLWKDWPRSARQRGRLTRGGWGLTDPAHARVGAVICEEIMKNLGNGKP